MMVCCILLVSRSKHTIPRLARGYERQHISDAAAARVQGASRDATCVIGSSTDEIGASTNDSHAFTGDVGTSTVDIDALLTCDLVTSTDDIGVSISDSDASTGDIGSAHLGVGTFGYHGYIEISLYLYISIMRT